MDAETLIRPVVEGANLELVEVTFSREAGRRILRVVVDRDGGLDLDGVAEVAEKISRRLDLEDYGDGRYELEVGTPGIERRLKTPAQFGRALGERVKVRTTAPIDGARVHEGVLAAADDASIVVEMDGAGRAIVLADVTSARTVVDWAAELKGSRT